MARTNWQQRVALFWSRVDVRGPDDCWPWQLRLTDDGYGDVRFLGKSCRAHRVSFFLTYGRWPEPCGLHRCDNRPCCNPAHVFEGTHKQNLADRDAKGRQARGDRHGFRRNPAAAARGVRQGLSVLDDDRVRWIRRAWPRLSTGDIAYLLRVSRGAVDGVLRGTTWRHV